MTNEMEILKRELELRIAQLIYENASKGIKKELYRVLKIYIPKAIKEAADAEKEDDGQG
ncbi:MAG: hypothetical protein L0956_10220 [Candidatus Mariimomonas ferrooxydans]